MELRKGTKGFVGLQFSTSEHVDAVCIRLHSNRSMGVTLSNQLSRASTAHGPRSHVAKVGHELWCVAGAADDDQITMAQIIKQRFVALGHVSGGSEVSQLVWRQSQSSILFASL